MAAHVLMRMGVNEHVTPEGKVHIIFVLTLTEGGDPEDVRPKVLWSLFFSQKDTSGTTLQSGLPENLFVLDGPNLELDFDHCIVKVCISVCSQ